MDPLVGRPLPSLEIRKNNPSLPPSFLSPLLSLPASLPPYLNVVDLDLLDLRLESLVRPLHRVHRGDGVLSREGGRKGGREG